MSDLTVTKNLNFSKLKITLSNQVTNKVHNYHQCHQLYIEKEQCLYNTLSKIHRRWTHTNDFDKGTFNSPNQLKSHQCKLNKAELIGLHLTVKTTDLEILWLPSCNLQCLLFQTHTHDCHQLTLINLCIKALSRNDLLRKLGQSYHNLDSNHYKALDTLNFQSTIHIFMR